MSLSSQITVALKGTSNGGIDGYRLSLTCSVNGWTPVSEGDIDWAFKIFPSS